MYEEVAFEVMVTQDGPLARTPSPIFCATDSDASPCRGYESTPVAGEQDSEEEREVNLRTMAEMNEDSPYNGYWDM